MKGNVVDMAVGVIIGGAFGKIVTSLVSDVIMPVIGMLTGGIAVNLAARSWTMEVRLPLQGWLAAACIVVLGTIVAFSLIMQGIQDVGPVKASMLAATEPLSATVFSALWLGTAFSWTDLIGFACIISTIFLLAKTD